MSKEVLNQKKEVATKVCQDCNFFNKLSPANSDSKVIGECAWTNFYMQTLLGDAKCEE